MNKKRINDLVAENVMGYVKSTWKGLEGWGTKDQVIWHSYFNPAGDITDAWKVVDKLKITICPQSEGAPKEMKYHAEINNQPLGNYYEAFAETAPLAISLVALKSIGVKLDA